MKLFIKIILVPIGLLFIYLAILFYNQFTYLHGATTGEMIDTKKMPHSALFVIDIQNIYPHPDKNLRSTNPVVFNLLSNVNAAIEHFEGSGNEIIYLAQVKEKKSIRSFFMPHIPARGTKEAEINTGIRTKNNPVIFTKLRADAFSNPDLQHYLNRKNTGTLFITGMAAEVCVDYTIQGAINRGYRVYVIRDALYAMFGEKSKEKRLQKYAGLGAKIISLEEFKSLDLK